MSAPHRIDVHQHAVPPLWAKALPTHGGDPSGMVVPQWSPESAIDFMDSQAIATGILSLTAPSVVRWDKSERREMARRVNEYTADLVAKRPDRFGNFATLPVPDVDGALREIEHALDTLRADGVIVPRLARRSTFRRLKQEYRVLERLKPHPQVVRVVWADKLPDETPYMVFEYAAGTSVGDLLNAGALSIEDIRRIAEDTLAGLEHLHASGISDPGLAPKTAPKACGWA
jgi:serine/threonine protein kinase